MRERDRLLTPPFLPPALQATRVFRLLRLLRLARAGSLARRVFSTEGVRDASVLALFAIVGGGAAFAAFREGSEPGRVGWRLVGDYDGDDRRLRRPLRDH